MTLVYASQTWLPAYPEWPPPGTDDRQSNHSPQSDDAGGRNRRDCSANRQALIGLTAIAITWKLIPNVRCDRSTKMPDTFGSVMAILTIGAVSFGLLNGAHWGWGLARILASWSVAVSAAVAFVISTNRAAVPVVDPKMFRSRVFASANV